MSETQATTVSTSSIFLTRVSLKNFRVSRDVSASIGRLVCLFGPNGCGKSTFLNALSFVSNFVGRGSIDAYALAGGSWSLFTQQPDEAAETSIEVSTENFEYRISLSQAMAQRGNSPNELASFRDEKTAKTTLFSRTLSTIEYVADLNTDNETFSTVQLLDPEASAWQPFLIQHTQNTNPPPLAVDLYVFRHFLQDVFLLKSRSIDLKKLGQHTQASQGLALRGDGLGLWNCWRNMRDSRASYSAYAKVKSWLQRAFPDFNDFEIVQTGPNSLSANIVEHSLPEPYPAASAPDGLLQFALVVCALYAPGNYPSLLLLDEPDLSLHPWAQFVLSEAIQDATQNWQRQVIVATHSPTLLNAFPVESLFLTESVNGESRIRCLADVDDARSLLESYGAGHLYMSQLIGEQSAGSMAEVIDADE